jgi:hypothetical protein
MTRADSLVRRACRWDIVRGALPVSAVVGVLLNVINQGQAVVDGLPIAWGYVAMNFAVPFLVSSYSAARNERGGGPRHGSAAECTPEAE